MAFAGALAFQAFIAGRKVRDSGDNRTNIYLLGLGHSASGKDWIRKVNAKVAHACGLSPCMGDRLASGEGIQDALFAHQNMLFQTDEIDGLLQTINKSRDGRHEYLMSTLLSMYSSSNSVFSMRTNTTSSRCDMSNIIENSILQALRNRNGLLWICHSRRIGPRIAQSAVEIAESLQFVTAVDGLFQKRPQAFGSQEQAFDSVGPPDAESSPAAGRSISIAAKNPLSANRLVTSVLLVVTAQEPVADQIANALAMRARRQFQLAQRCFEIFL
jgi:hypothetical protein